MGVMDFIFSFFKYIEGRAILVWIVFFCILLRNSKKICCHFKRILTDLEKSKERHKGPNQEINELKQKIGNWREIKQILIGIIAFSISFVLLMIFAIINATQLMSFMFLVVIVSACISAFLLLKVIAISVFDFAIYGNSDYKAEKTIRYIKGIYYILMFYWGGVFFIFGENNLEKSFYSKWADLLDVPEIGFLYTSYYLLIIATILLLAILSSIVFGYDLKKQIISERIKFIIFNYFQLLLLLTGLVTCSSILFGDFSDLLTELTINGFFNCLYTVFFSLQDISILYNEVVSVYGKIVLIICSFCNLLFIGMFIGAFLERE